MSVSRKEKELLEGARAGDRGAAGELVREHERTLWLFLWRMTGSRDRTEELFQETWLRVWRNLANFREEASFRTYLLRVARHLVFDGGRARALGPLEHEPAAHSDDQPETRALSEERSASIARLLQRLPSRQREALVLHHLHGLPFGEVATILEIEESTARHYAHEARRKAATFARQHSLDEHAPDREAP